MEKEKSKNKQNKSTFYKVTIVIALALAFLLLLVLIYNSLSERNQKGVYYWYEENISKPTAIFFSNIFNKKEINLVVDEIENIRNKIENRVNVYENRYTLSEQRYEECILERDKKFNEWSNTEKEKCIASHPLRGSYNDQYKEEYCVNKFYDENRCVKLTEYLGYVDKMNKSKSELDNEYNIERNKYFKDLSKLKILKDKFKDLYETKKPYE